MIVQFIINYWSSAVFRKARSSAETQNSELVAVTTKLSRYCSLLLLGWKLMLMNNESNCKVCIEFPVIIPLWLYDSKAAMIAGCSSSHSLVPGPHPCYHGPQPSQPSCNCQSPGADVVYITWDLTPWSQQPAQPARGSNTENRDRNGRPVCLKSADPTMVLEFGYMYFI